MRTKQRLLTLLTLLACPALMCPSLFAGTVSGKVTYTGTPAHQKSIDMSKEPSCAKQHATPITTETVVTGAGNALDNVVVYVSAGAPDEGQVPSRTAGLRGEGLPQKSPSAVPGWPENLRSQQLLKQMAEDAYRGFHPARTTWH
jgi:hypothetical protein